MLPYKRVSTQDLSAMSAVVLTKRECSLWKCVGALACTRSKRSRVRVAPGPLRKSFPRLHFGVSGGFHVLEVPLEHRSHGEPAGGNLPLLLSNPSHQLRELAWVRERYFPSLRLTPNVGLDRPHFL